VLAPGHSTRGGAKSLGVGGCCLHSGLSLAFGYGMLGKSPNRPVLSFLLCKMGVRMKPTSQGGCEKPMRSEPGGL
jgi:hypothetical protein